jgi:hypothetical protein
MPSAPSGRRVSRSFDKESTFIMSDGVRQVSIPRHNPIKAVTMGGIVRDAGLTPEEFRDLL